jgi:hypothetical protein
MGARREFLEDLKEALEDIEVSGEPLFNLVWISPFFDPEMAIKVPRIPMAVVHDTGGTLDTTQGEIWQRSFSITIVASVPRDHMAEATVLELLDIGESMLEEVKFFRDTSVMSVSDGEADVIPIEGGIILVAHTYTFRYTLDIGA